MLIFYKAIGNTKPNGENATFQRQKKITELNPITTTFPRITEALTGKFRLRKQ
jgi:hypothetical protein